MVESDPSDSLGGRIRKLRQERGYSLAQVCGGEFSRAFLNQVELGRSQPSTRVLRVIAARLGTGIEYLVEGGLTADPGALAVERARVALAEGRAARALAEVQPALGAPWPVGGDARVTRAAALLRLNRREEAEPILAEAEAEARAQRDSIRLARIAGIRAGGSGGASAREHLREAEAALRAGNEAMATEHYRSARLLLENARLLPQEADQMTGRPATRAAARLSGTMIKPTLE